jgi:hypothetical protein
MNRSNKGFGLTGVIITVILLMVAAIFSASAKSSPVPQLAQHTIYTEFEPLTKQHH